MSKSKAKKLLSTILIFAMLITTMPFGAFAANKKPLFRDIKGDEYYATAAEILGKLGILQGYPDGTFGATKDITRAEITAIVLRSQGLEDKTVKALGKTIYDDISADHWASGYINKATELKIIQGDGNGKFRPNDNVKYEEAVKIIVRSVGLGNAATMAGGWPDGYIKVAQENGILKNVPGSKGSTSIRGVVTLMTYQALLTEIKTPVASLTEGKYTSVQKITLTTETKDAEIYYTLDGTIPTTQSTKYNGEFILSKSANLKAIAVKSELLVSDVFSVEYTITRATSNGSGGGNGSTAGNDSNSGDNDSSSSGSSSDGDSKLAPIINIDITNLEAYDIDTFVVNEKITSLKGTITQNTSLSKLTVTTSVEKLETSINTIDPKSNWSLANPVLLVGKNTVTIKATASNGKSVEKKITIFNSASENAANAELDEGDDDGDGLLNWQESIYDTDKINPDTDDDGLTDYFEVILAGTSPLLVDSDQNGAPDGNEDFDGDDLTNIQEMLLNGNPWNTDADSDGLTDYEESIFGTKLDVEDTDEDGLSDKDEIDLGTNALHQKTDGVTLDSERIFTQSLKNENIAAPLLSKENETVPSLSFSGAGNINGGTFVSEAFSYELDDNKALRGTPIEISTGNNVATGATLSFGLSDALNSDLSSDTVLLICQLTEDGEIIPLETAYNGGTHTIEATIFEPGIYFVLDAYSFLLNLGFDPLSYFQEAKIESFRFPASSYAEEDQTEYPDAVRKSKSNTHDEHPITPTSPLNFNTVSETESEIPLIMDSGAKEEDQTEDPDTVSKPKSNNNDEQSITPTLPLNFSTVSETENEIPLIMDSEAKEEDQTEDPNTVSKPKSNDKDNQSVISTSSFDFSTLSDFESEIQLMADSGAKGQADIVFIVDATGSMQDEINNVAYNINSFAQKLVSTYNINANLGIVEYKDITYDGIDSTVIRKNGASNWFNAAAISNFRDTINRIKIIRGAGGDTPESAIDALETARQMVTSSRSQKFFVLVTDANYKVDNRYGINSMAEMIDKLKADDINVSVITDTYERNTYSNLYTQTGGIFANIYSNFASALGTIADMIGTDVNDGYWVYLKGNWTPVKLDAEPKAGSTVDTDGDGMKDMDELTSMTGEVGHLRSFIEPLLKSKGKTWAEYVAKGGQQWIYVWGYRSNPAITDTDQDGYPDSIDSNPKEWDISDRDLAMSAEIAYLNILKGTNLDNLSASWKNILNGNFAGAAYIEELKGWKVLDTWYATGLQGIALKKDNNIIVAYRGSEMNSGAIEFFADWIIADGLGVITGMNAQAPAAKTFMKNIMKNNKGNKFYVTGHSLGGYLAYQAGSKAIAYDNDSLIKINQYNGLGLVYGITLGIFDVVDERRLISQKHKITNYRVNGDIVSKNPFAFHYGTTFAYDKSAGTTSRHSLYTFYTVLGPLNRSKP